MTQTQKNEILQLLDDEKQRLGSYRAVAAKCGISEATISQLRKGVYAAAGDDIYHTIATALGYEFDTSGWRMAEITNYRIISNVLQDAKSESMFMGIAHRAGSGKTATSSQFLAANRRNGAFMVTCKEWSGRTFLAEVAKELGADVPKGYASVSTLIEAIGEAVRKIANTKPILILDQANSLKPSALRSLIHVHNELEDVLGVAILGTDNLETEIKRGVRLNKTGYDELDSRFGRTYIHLIGATLGDTRKICEANGILDKEAQDGIFKACTPIRITVEDKSVMVVEDIRVIKRKVKGHLLQLKHAS